MGVFVLCFKQRTAYEMRISDWSSDVCSSDLSAFPGLASHLCGLCASARIFFPRRGAEAAEKEVHAETRRRGEKALGQKTLFSPDAASRQDVGRERPLRGKHGISAPPRLRVNPARRRPSASRYALFAILPLLSARSEEHTSELQS